MSTFSKVSDDIQLRINKLSTKVKIVGAAIVALIVSPIIYSIIGGMVGIGVAALAGLGLVNFLPVASMKFANWKLKAIKAEASQNPIETMQNIRAEKSQEIEAFAAEITELDATVLNFASKLESFKKKFPNEASSFEDQLRMRRASVERKWSKHNKLKEDLATLDGIIERAASILEMSQVSMAADKADRRTQMNTYQKIRMDTSMDSVLRQVNQSFAEMRREMEESKNEESMIQSLENKPSPVLIPPVNQAESSIIDQQRFK